MTIDRGTGGAAPAVGAVQYVRVDDLADPTDPAFGDNMVAVHITGQAATTLHAWLENPVFANVAGNFTLGNTLFLGPNGRIDLNRNAGVADAAIGFAGRMPGNLSGANVSAGQFISQLPITGGIGNAVHQAFFLRVDTPNIAESFASVMGLNIASGSKGALATITAYSGLNVQDAPVAAFAAGIQCGVSSGAARWNIYAVGTAANYFAGQVQFGDGLLGTPSISFASSPAMGFFAASAAETKWAVSGVDVLDFRVSGIHFQAGTFLAWTATSASGTVDDIVLRRDAAATLAQRDGVNAQAFRIYNTFTDAANYERGEFAWSGNQLFLLTNQAGTGVARQLVIGTVGAASLVFEAGGTTRWQVDSTGNLKTVADNTYDIGATAATRPRSIFFGTQMRAADGVVATPSYAFDNEAGLGFYRRTTGVIEFTGTGAAGSFDFRGSAASVIGNAISFKDVGALVWSADANPNLGGGIGLALFMDAANILAQRNAGNAQTLRVYGTFTDAANYQRMTITQSTVQTEAAGTGTLQALTIGPSTAPWRFSAGGFIALTDNALDIGANGATRPRSGYFAQGLAIGPTAGAASAGIISLDRTASASLTMSTGGVVDGQVRVTAASTISITDSTGGSPRLSVATGAAGNVSLLPGGDILWGKALVALGGGAPPTLGTIGATGPATAAQNTWLRLLDSTGAACWVPVWK